MKKILFFILLSVILSACGQQKGENVETTFEKPPELIVSSNGNEVVAVLGTYSWSYDNGDGTFKGIEADSFGTTEIVKLQSHPLKTKLGSEVVLEFTRTPKEIKVTIWDNNQALRELEVEGNTFTTDEKGNIVYEVYATWDQGSAHYAVQLNVK
ncbi:membrane lipoprotein lipid attachment site-containing protein [Sporosarcina highlanderae]|uniref:Membrane lipoprotein lipid attachment site-containing protein n=1 Tax=Sporosarcina highlanderae TaxID=3035916 RepID=A0ABT8JU15_9BACL|nr:membrane lipoprotein lipid attachment site-containing protein [Sporosarcina highlanderae]MDN4608554.1 membrane lipoprotein lipid attachment site-containing protein [Sporosarcina highlanderae]